ncbi:iron ABC transporter permease [Lysinibacillus boronitolerans]|nr:iron ABC transporter permease [Lysinibacillus boronitolerans]
MKENMLQFKKKLRNEPLLLVLVFTLLTIMTFLIIYPIARVVMETNGEIFSQLWTNVRWRNSLVNTVFITILSTLSSTIVAFIFAYTMARLDVPCKGLFRIVTLLPIVSPPFIVALSYILLFGRQGIITNHLLGIPLDIYGWTGLWAVQTISFFPYAYAVIYGVVKAASIQMEYAAYNLGATKWQVFTDVFLNLCRPGIAGGALVVAMSILADFGNPMIIGGNFSVLSTEAYAQMTGWFDIPAAAMLATTMLVPALSLFLINRLWVGNRSYVTVTGKDSSLQPYPIAAGVKWLLFSFCMLVSVVVVLVYSTLVYGAFTTTWGYDWTLTLDNMVYVVGKQQEITNSIVYAVCAAVGAALLSVLVAYLVQRKQFGLNKWMDFLAVLPGAIPGVFLSLGFAFAFGGDMFSLTGTSLIIILALMIWNLPTCYSANAAALQQIGPSIEEASTNLGATCIQTYFKVLLPLVRTSFISSMVLAFLRSVTCLSVVIFIYSLKTSVGTITIIGLLSNGQWGAASAVTITLIGIAISVLLLTKLAFRLRGKTFEI